MDVKVINGTKSVPTGTYYRNVVGYKIDPTTHWFKEGVKDIGGNPCKICNSFSESDYIKVTNTSGTTSFVKKSRFIEV